MRSILFTVTLSLLLTWSCEQQQQQQKEQVKYHNLSIMLNSIESDMPLSLKNSIAASCSIILEYFVPRTNSFMLSTNIQVPNLEKYMKDFLNNVLVNLSMVKVEIESFNSDLLDNSINRKYNMIVVDSVESLRQLDPAKFTQYYDIQEYYLIYVMHAPRFSDELLVVNEIFAYFWQNAIINVSLMKVNKNSVAETYTYYPFGHYLSCKMPLVTQTNAYDGSWLHPISLTIFPAKITNLRGCPLNVAVFDTPPYLSYSKNSEGFYEIGYFEAVLLNVLAEKLNFSLNLLESPNNEERGRIFPNGTITGALKMLHEHSADLSLGSFRYTLQRSQLLTAALPYYQTYQVYSMLTTSQLYSFLEILVYPFDRITWICLFLSLLTGLLLAFIIQYFYDHSILVRIAIGFPRFRTPMTNIISIFLGQPIQQIPQTNLARSLIQIWYIFGLLMRTLYQSLLFQSLQLNLYHRPPETLEELIDRGCMLVMTERTYISVYALADIEKGSINVIRLNNISEHSVFSFIESNRQLGCLASVCPKDYLTYYVNQERKSDLFYVLPEIFFSQHITMYFSKHSFLINRFDELFMNLRGAGLIDFWAEQSIDSAEAFVDVDENVFTPINIGNLAGVLFINAILYLITVIAFVAEIFIYRINVIIFGARHEFIH